MQGDEARVLLGFPPYSRPTLSQVKAACRKKVWVSHSDIFPFHKKPCLEFGFKLTSESYTYLLSAVDIYLWGSCNRSVALGKDFQCVKELKAKKLLLLIAK
ncbi:uncharacterized protein LOC122725246 [Manihot esculenta]|uniref:uncharacterized protein LOC122725246 n=1 Tax=Manihot esculenta TaxID=3983 RepID=UPI001CC41CB0|nr:uncharacterized protein LOC122725246 [Manihot esculenta]